jgi:hypothetical protein
MATVSNVRLEISRTDDSRRRRVTVRYRVCFSACEALAGSVFVERVQLRGDDPIWDDNLITLRNTCVRANEAGCVDRVISSTVAASTLDEDPDTIIFGLVIGDRDEIYARVTLTPFAPTGATANSNIVTGQFGPAGN